MKAPSIPPPPPPWPAEEDNPPGLSPPPSKLGTATTKEAARSSPGIGTNAGSHDEVNFVITMKKRELKATSLGIDVTYSAGSGKLQAGILVAKIFADGLIARWNQICPRAQKIFAGDFVIRVNDVKGDAVAMIQEIRAKDELTLQILRSPESDGDHGAAPPSAPPLPVNMVQQAPKSKAPGAKAPGAGACPAAQAYSRQEVPGESAPPLRQRGLPGLPPGPPPPPPPEAHLQGSDALQAMIPHIMALSDEDFASVICIVVERRPSVLQQLLQSPGFQEWLHSGSTMY